jgi:hypothetical protein
LHRGIDDVGNMVRLLPWVFGDGEGDGEGDDEAGADEGDDGIIFG